MTTDVRNITVLYRGAPPPTYQSEGAAGCDIVAAEDAVVPAGQWAVVPTGFHIEIPDGFECQVRSRSGLAAKNGIFVLNSPGTIDPDYRGEIRVILGNSSASDFIVKKGDRVAQLVFAPIIRATFQEVQEFSATVRGDRGFGSTGL